MPGINYAIPAFAGSLGRASWGEYTGALLATAVAVVVRWALDPLLGNAYPLGTLYAAIAIAVWYGGWGPALLAAGVGYLACNFLFIPPRQVVVLAGPSELAGLAVYLVSCIVIAGFGAALHTARRHAARAALALAERQGELEERQKQLEREIAERTLTEAKLREASERTSGILESITDAFYALDRDWRYTYVNRRAEQYYQRSKETLLGRKIWEVFPQLLEADSYQQYHKALEEDVPVHYEMLSPVTGRWIEVHAYPSPEGLSVFFNDVGERKLTQDALRESRERFEAFMEHSPARAWIKDEEGRYVFVNRMLERAYGRQLEEWLGRTDFDLFPAGVAEAFRANDRAVLDADKASQFVERAGEGGVEHFVLSVRFPVRSPEGRRYIGGMGIDITEQAHAEQALREADRRKDEFLATLAHELRNPLNPIRSAVAIMRRAGPGEAAFQWSRDVVDRQVKQMARLLDDLLDVSRITLNRLELRVQIVELAGLIQHAVETARPQIDLGQHHLLVTIPPEPIRLQADPVRLAQVFSNLLNNAAKYTDQGGRIWLDVTVQPDQVEVSVEDDGMGIEPEHLPRIFDMFSQTKPALSRSQGGLGIGLSLVKALVSMHGGEVEAHSEGPGQGSRFTVRLPLLTKAQAEELQQTNQAGNVPRRLSRRILVVDDNRDSADSCAILLRLQGHAVRTAYDGVSALQVAGSFRPEIVFLDIGLPQVNGYDVARRIRIEPWSRDTVLVAMTGWGQEDDKSRAIESGFDRHLTKPVSADVFDEILAEFEKARVDLA
jgi:PAS domain S-box-containing protein